MTDVAPAKLSPAYLAILALALSLSILLAWPGLAHLWEQWQGNEAYSHGPVIVALAAYFAWQQRGAVRSTTFVPTWFAIPLLLAALTILVFARRAEIHIFVQYALLGVFIGLAIGTVGWSALKLFAISWVLLFLAIPLPGFLEMRLTAELKLLSSQAGAAVLQLFDIPVYVDGNIIDLGVYRLHVVDACSGLNYLVPLLAIGFILAGFMRAELWKRALVIAITIPITMFMNVIRISVTGLLVKYVGPGSADGFLHDFEGWLIFVACVAILLPSAALILRLGRQPTTLGEALQLDFSPGSVPVTAAQRRPPRTLVTAVLLIGASLGAVQVLGYRAETYPERQPLTFFPRMIEDWTGTTDALAGDVIDMLALTDYVLARYRSPHQAEPVDLYVSYHRSQKQGAMPHSPSICLPGSGWETLSLERRELQTTGGGSFPVVRAVMQNEHQKRLVYYWFQQRGVVYSNEYLMRIALFRDSILLNRTDGGMIRVMTPISGGVAAAEDRLMTFITKLTPLLPRYVPD